MTHVASIPAISDSIVPPRHVAIIMDGNGRWARARGLPRIEGHRKGAESVHWCVRAAVGLGVEYLTLFGFSSENWRRTQGEISALMGLLRLYLKNEVHDLHDNGIRLVFIGDRRKLDADIASMIADAEAMTVGNTRLCLTVALSYGSRDEITDAARGLARDVLAGRITPDDIDGEAIEARLETADLPDPDLLIRTSGEQRISNFLLWQCAYTEFVFVDTLWPDFGATEFETALADYCRRERRFGVAGI